MALWISVCIVLVDSQSSVPNTYIGHLTTACTPAAEDPVPPWAPTLMWMDSHTHTCTHTLLKTL